MRIGIDARFFGPGTGTGIGRYIERLLLELDRIETDHTFVVLLGDNNFSDFKPNHETRFEKVRAPWRWYSLGEQIHLPRLLRKLQLDLVHFPHFNVPLAVTGPFVVTVHDLILNKFPTERASTLEPIMYRIKHAVYLFVIRMAIRRARYILAVSENTKRDICETYHVPSEKVSVTYEACDMPGDREISGIDVAASFGVQRPFLLYVGNTYPHKNMERCVEAMSLLRKQGTTIQLVVVGRDDYFSQRLREYVKKILPPEAEQAIIFTGYVDDRVLNALFEAATLYIFPSLYEGFGLPGLEAMARGLPVISARASCLPEIFGEAAAYFDPLRVPEMAKVIQEVLNDQKRQQDLRTAGYERVRKYSWKRMAEQTLDVYNRFGGTSV